MNRVEPALAEAALYDHVNQLLAGHEKLLRDENRNRLFYEALKQCVTRDSTVLDIGSGTGLWAIAAALLGAKRVVAIEQDVLLIGLIRALAQANGVADRIEVLHGDSRQIHLDREFDIVISETIGHLVFDEQIVPIMLDARERFLKPNGIVIPQSVALMVAAAHFEQPQLPHGIPVSYDYFESLLLNHPVGLTERSKISLITAPQVLVSADLTGSHAPPDLKHHLEHQLEQLAARWQPQTTDQINCFAVWAEATLAPGIRLETMQTSSWFPTLYRITPFKRAFGEIEFKLSLTSSSHYWTVTLTSDNTHETQSYSPAAAATALLARSRTNVDLLDHLRQIGITPQADSL